jgi:hypothetical protein
MIALTMGIAETALTGPACDEKYALLAMWSDAARAFSDELSAMIPRDNPRAEGVALARLELARQRCENARLLFMLHRKEHGC